MHPLTDKLVLSHWVKLCFMKTHPCFISINSRHESEFTGFVNSETRTKNQSILNGSLATMLKSPAICHAVKGEMMVYINPYLQLLIFQAYVVNETYKNMQNVMTKRMRCSVVCHIRHRIRHRMRHRIRYCSTT